MSTAVIVTLAGLAVLVLALALFLIAIILVLAGINSALGDVLARAQALSRHAGPLEATMVEVRGNISAVVELLRDAGSASLSGRR
jgi:hypothetical protein